MRDNIIYNAKLKLIYKKRMVKYSRKINHLMNKKEIFIITIYLLFNSIIFGISIKTEYFFSSNLNSII